MTNEINLPGLPAGYRAVRWGIPRVGERVLVNSGKVIEIAWPTEIMGLIVEPILDADASECPEKRREMFLADLVADGTDDRRQDNA